VFVISQVRNSGGGVGGGGQKVSEDLGGAGGGGGGGGGRRLVSKPKLLAFCWRIQTFIFLNQCCHLDYFLMYCPGLL